MVVIPRGWDAAGSQWVESQDTAKHPTMHRTKGHSPTTNNDSAPNVNSGNTLKNATVILFLRKPKLILHD